MNPNLEAEPLTEGSRNGSRWSSPRFWLIVAGLALVAYGLFWLGTRGRTSTDNARIEGPVHAISARVEGEVVEVFVELNQVVEAGAALFRLDARDFELALAHAGAELASAQAEVEVATSGVSVGAAEANSNQSQARSQETNAAASLRAAERGERRAAAQQRAAQAALQQAQARARRTADDLARLQPLAAKQQIAEQVLAAAQSEAAAAAAAAEQQEALVEAAAEELAIARSLQDVSQGELQQARAARRSADTAPQKVAAIEAQANLARARLAEAEAALERARLDLEDTTVRAPLAATVGRKNLEVGQFVRRGQAVMALVGHEVWVEANFKETQMRNMRPGQPANLRVDAYPGKLRGVVHSIGPATGSRFSLLPADNSSGNFVKVVQRVPVKIVLVHEEADDPKPLRPGMSVRVTVRLSDS